MLLRQQKEFAEMLHVFGAAAGMVAVNFGEGLFPAPGADIVEVIRGIKHDGKLLCRRPAPPVLQR
jgi:hypothetical protein